MYYTFTPDNLVDISRPARTDIYKIAKKSGDLKRGQVLGLVTNTPSGEGEKAAVGTLKPCVSTSEDGSQVPFAVLAEDSAELGQSVHAGAEGKQTDQSFHLS